MMTQHTRWNVLVAIRIPRDGGADIQSDALRRLQGLSCIESAEIVGLEGIEPALSATVARFEIEALTDTAQAESGIRKRLASATGIESVERVTPAA